MGAKQIRVGEFNFYVVDEGNGLAVLLLHGFPDSSDLWRNQIPALVDAGLRGAQ
jgi:pimeloyl-ACP methyl ester carboxylesterase